MTLIPGDRVEHEELTGRSSADPLRSLPAASSLRLVRLTRQPQRTAHRHPHSEEVIHVRKGAGVVFVDGARHRVRAGDTVLVPAGVAHATIPDAGATMELICFFPHPDLAANYEETEIDVMTEDHDG